MIKNDCAARPQLRSATFNGFRLLSALMLLLLFTGEAFAQSQTHAAIRFWNVRNWYPIDGDEWQKHRYQSPRDAFLEQWSSRTTFPCGVGSPDSAWYELQDVQPVDVGGYEPGAIANAQYVLHRCNGTTSAPSTYGSAAIRFWGCSNSGPWHHPLLSEGEPVCVVTDDGAEPEANRGSPPCPDGCFGDPINAGTANKFEIHTEYRGQGVFPLELIWTYNSSGTSAIATPTDLFLGRNRSHTYSRRVSLSSTATVTTAYVSRPDGNTLRFNQVGSDWIGAKNRTARLYSTTDAGSIIGWRLEDGKGFAEVFDADGKLIELVDPQGHKQALDYDDVGRLESVIDMTGRALVFEYGSPTRLSKLHLPDGSAISFFYTANDDLERVEYPGGASIQYRYDEAGYAADASSNGALTGVIDEASVRYSSTTYNAGGQATSTSLAGSLDTHTGVYQPAANGTYSARATISLPAGATRQVDFTVRQGLVVPASAATSCDGCTTQTTSYTYDPNGHTDVVTRQGVATDLDYDARGLLSQKIEAANDATGKKRKVQTDWHVDFAVPTERRVYDAADALVSKQAWTYNSRGQALTGSQIDPITGATRTSTTTYCEQPAIDAGTCPLLGLVTQVDGPRTDVSDVTTYTYYPSDDATCATAPTTCPHRKGDLWKVTNALGHVSETLQYDGAGRVLSVKDANGVITDLEYHPRGWLTARKTRGTDGASETDDQITRIDYYPTGLVQKTTLPDGSYTAYTYDAAHRLTDITDGEGNKIHYTLDNAGNRTQEDTLGHTGDVLRTLSRVYNQLGQMQTQKDAYDHATGFAFDANGNTETVTDALSRVTDNDYDPLDRLTRTIQNVGGLNVTTQFQYDARDNLTAVVDPKNLTTGYTYNGLGDLTQLSSPDTGVTSYTYDSAGNRQTQTDARGVTTTYTYDALNRLTYVSYPNTNLNVTYTYTYDVANPLCPADERFSLGRLNKLKHSTYGTQYCYNRFGQLTRKAQVNNARVDLVVYGYTKAGQLSSVTYPDGSVADYVRDALGRTTEVGVTRPGGSRQVLLTAASYYPFGPAAEWVFGNGRLFKRSLNQNYQPGFVEGASPGGLSFGYEFDAVGNLSKLRLANQTDPPKRVYAYDALNRLTEARDGAGVLMQGYSYDATGNRESATASGVTTAYTTATDSHRLLQTGAASRSYDAVGNTTAISSTAREYVYNDAGRMSQVKQNGAVVMNYDYNGKGEQIRRSFGTTDVQIVYDEAGHWLGEYDATGVPLQQVIWLDDLPVGLLVGAAADNQPLHYIEADALGTPRRVIDPQRNVAVWNWPLTFEPFGAEGPLEDADGDGTNFVFNLRFPGQRYDAATGLNYNYFRDYEAGTGRYAESDPIGLAGGIATFSYAMGNPLSLIDPNGQKGISGRMPFPPPPGSTQWSDNPGDLDPGNVSPWGNPPVIVWPPRPPAPTTPLQGVPEPLPPPGPKGPGSGCRGMFEACMKGANICPVIIKQGMYGICLAAFIACEAAGGGGGSDGGGGPDISGWGAQ
jgi:RHS repeat-associated protein